MNLEEFENGQLLRRGIFGGIAFIVPRFVDLINKNKDHNIINRKNTDSLILIKFHVSLLDWKKKHAAVLTLARASSSS